MRSPHISRKQRDDERMRRDHQKYVDRKVKERQLLRRPGRQPDHFVAVADELQGVHPRYQYRRDRLRQHRDQRHFKAAVSIDRKIRRREFIPDKIIMNVSLRHPQNAGQPKRNGVNHLLAEESRSRTYAKIPGNRDRR